MQSLAEALLDWFLSFLAGSIHCHCHGEEMPSS